MDELLSGTFEGRARNRAVWSGIEHPPEVALPTSAAYFQLLTQASRHGVHDFLARVGFGMLRGNCLTTKYTGQLQKCGN